MPDYELRYINERGKTVWSHPFKADGDLIAIGLVLQSDSPHAKELWRGDNKLMDFPAEEA
jgi:hypothetical protein